MRKMPKIVEIKEIAKEIKKTYRLVPAEIWEELTGAEIANSIYVALKIVEQKNLTEDEKRGFLHIVLRELVSVTLFSEKK